MVRFQFQGTIYPVKNFTKLYGCKRETQAYNKLQEIKLLISQGKNPFSQDTFNLTLNSVWKEWFNRKITNGDWGKTVQRNYTYYYNAYIKPVLGLKRIDRIKYADAVKILDSLAGKGFDQQNTLKKLMKPMFDHHIKLGHIEINVFDKIDKVKDKNKGSKAILELRTDEKPLDIVKKLYKAIPEYEFGPKSKSIQILLYLTLLTGHRVGEVNDTKRKDILLKERKVIAPAEITKTNIDYHYPLPEEVVDYIKDMDPDDKLVTTSKNSHTSIFRRWIKKAGVSTHNGKHLSFNDLRRLVASVMVMECGIDSALADATLEHKQNCLDFSADYMTLSHYEKTSLINSIILNTTIHD
jgi:integrase